MATEEEFGSSDWCRAFCVILLVGGVVGVTGSYALDSLIGLIEPDLPPARLGPSMLCGLAFGSLRVWHMLLRYLAFPFGFCGDLVSEVLGALLVPPSLLRHAWAWGPNESWAERLIRYMDTVLITPHEQTLYRVVCSDDVAPAWWVRLYGSRESTDTE